MNKPHNRTKRLDRISIWMSVACLFQCLVFPILTISLPVFGSYYNYHFHAIMLFFIIPISAIAFYYGFKHHRNKNILVVGFFGAFFLILGATLVHNYLDNIFDVVITITGSFFLAAAHFNNHQMTHTH